MLYDEDDFLNTVGLLVFIFLFAYVIAFVFPYQLVFGAGLSILLAIGFFVFLFIEDTKRLQGFVIGLVVMFGLLVMVLTTYYPQVKSSYDSRLNWACRMVESETDMECSPTLWGHVEICRGKYPVYDCDEYSVGEDLTIKGIRNGY